MLRPLWLTLPVDAEEFISTLSTVFVREFFSRASSLRLRESEPSDYIFPPATWAY